MITLLRDVMASGGVSGLIAVLSLFVAILALTMKLK
ncbi:hypothetical protein JOD69_004407 [Methylocaldum sp. RMAD-M]|jgi:hypothetical protein|nr:hypothetical protein [Methylocaldum sp. RMAD-M]